MTAWTTILVLALWVSGCNTMRGAVDSGDACTDAPMATWDHLGGDLLRTHCQSCHSSSAPDRHDAPEEVIFDEKADACEWEDRILARATGEEPTMPPAGGMETDERELLAAWLTCWTDC